MSTFPSYIHRVFKPSEWDKAPIGTGCRTEDDEYYVQISRDEENPEWYPVSSKEQAEKLIKEILHIN